MFIEGIGEVEKTPINKFRTGEEYHLVFKNHYVPVLKFYDDPSKDQTEEQAIVRLKEAIKKNE